MTELFSDVAEEKEVTKITGKVKEARSCKSYSIFQIVSKYISENLLLDLIAPLREVIRFKEFSKWIWMWYIHFHVHFSLTLIMGVIKYKNLR